MTIAKTTTVGDLFQSLSEEQTANIVGGGTASAVGSASATGYNNTGLVVVANSSSTAFDINADNPVAQALGANHFASASSYSGTFLATDNGAKTINGVPGDLDKVINAILP